VNKEDLLAMVGIGGNSDQDTVRQIVEQTAERGDMDELRHLAVAGSKDAADQLVELAQEREDLDQLRRRAADGNQGAADILTERAGGEF